MAGRQPEEAGTRTAVLDSAEQLVSRRGFNGFSYADVADELGITKAALHYYFPGKAELGEALLARYASRFAHALAEIDSVDSRAFEKLRGYAELYLDVLRGARMCLCGMLAAEYETLPRPMRQTVVAFFDDNVAWLSSVLEKGRDDGSLSFDGKPDDAAELILGTLEGAMLVARAQGDVKRFEAVVNRLLRDFSNRGQSTATPPHLSKPRRAPKA